MAKSLDPQPTQFRQMYFSLHPDIADELKLVAMQERKHQRVLLTEIITAYVESKRGKAKK
jgi:hypothetical protein